MPTPIPSRFVPARSYALRRVREEFRKPISPAAVPAAYEEANPPCLSTLVRNKRRLVSSRLCPTFVFESHTHPLPNFGRHCVQGLRELELVKRQSAISQMYVHRPSILEKKQ